eukprot:1148593-Pelagomonas_calceolata.AAC.1
MEQPYLQQVSIQAAYDVLLQHNNKLFLFGSELTDIKLSCPLQAHSSAPPSSASRLRDFMNLVAKQIGKMNGRASPGFDCVAAPFIKYAAAPPQRLWCARGAMAGALSE